MGWIAYVDESMRQRSAGEGIYVIAAATLDEVDADAIRQRLIGLAPTRRSRIHWRDATVSERRKTVAAIAELDVLHFVVVGTRLNSRTTSLNAKDYAAVQAWRAQNAVRGDLRVDFAQPFGPVGDQLLWLPDVVAGAVSTARGDGDPQYLMDYLRAEPYVEGDVDIQRPRDEPREIAVAA